MTKRVRPPAGGLGADSLAQNHNQERVQRATGEHAQWA